MVVDDEKGATMGVRIEVGSYNGILENDETRRGLSATRIDSGSVGLHSNVIEIRVSTDGATTTLQLTKPEAGAFSLMLAKLADDDGDAGPALSPIPHEEGRTATRDELIAALLTLPRESEIDLQLGTEHIAITGVMPWGGQGWAALQCHPADFEDLLSTWQVPAAVQEAIACQLP
jgi:hypothetical protein